MMASRSAVSADGSCIQAGVDDAAAGSIFVLRRCCTCVGVLEDAENPCTAAIATLVSRRQLQGDEKANGTKIKQPMRRDTSVGTC